MPFDSEVFDEVFRDKRKSLVPKSTVKPRTVRLTAAAARKCSIDSIDQATFTNEQGTWLFRRVNL